MKQKKKPQKVKDENAKKSKLKKKAEPKMITNRSNRSSSEIFSFFPYLDLLRDFFINKQEKQNRRNVE